jgi:DHA1 family multidrug resistance protein-like MFS transporter
MAVNWKRNAMILAFVELVARSMMLLVRPFIPFYLPELGVTAEADIAYWTGLLTSALFISQAATAPLWGALADKLGRKIMVLRSVCGMAIFSLLLALAVNPWQFMLLRFLMGAVSGVNTAAMALIAATTPEKHTGYAIGLLQTGFMAGSFVGPSLGAIAAEIVGYKGCFILSGLIVLLLMPFVIFGVQENFQTQSHNAKEYVRKNGDYLRFWRCKPLFFLLAVLFLTQFCLQGCDSFIPLHIKEFYRGDRLNAVSAIVFGVSAAATAVMSPRLGRWGDRVGNRRVIQVCLLGAGFCLMAQGLSAAIWPLLAVRILSGAFIGGLVPNCYTAISHQTTPETRGSIIGLSGSFAAIGSFGGPLFSGVFAAEHGTASLFLLLGALMLAAWAAGLRPGVFGSVFKRS